jgi:endonuclease YncB( thermonuclease family)
MTTDQNYENIQSFAVSDLDEFDLSGHQSWGFLKRAIDGDSQIFAAYYSDNPFLFRCRLIGIDTAELRSKNQEEYIHAMKAKDYVLRFCRSGPVWLTFHGLDNFGRWLVKCYSQNKESCLNDLLIDEGLAVPYTSPKTKFRNWPRSHIHH